MPAMVLSCSLHITANVACKPLNLKIRIWVPIHVDTSCIKYHQPVIRNNAGIGCNSFNVKILFFFSFLFFSVARLPYLKLYVVSPTITMWIVELLSFVCQLVRHATWMAVLCILQSLSYFWQTSRICLSHLEKSF